MRTSLLISLLIWTVHSIAQNLIPNPSFEDENICTEHTASCAPAGWITPSPHLPEYRGPKGQKHVGLIGFNSNKRNVRQYIQTQLLCPLEAGAEKIRGCVIGSGFKENGYNKIFNDNDDIWQDGEFRNGKLWDGKLYEYDSDGILMRVRVYKEGGYHSDGLL